MARPLHRIVATLAAFALLASGAGAQSIIDDLPVPTHRPRVVVIADAEGGPSEAAALLASIATQTGDVDLRLVSVHDAGELRRAVREARAPIVAIAVHGTEAGVEIGGRTIAWSDLARDIRAGSAREVLLLACHSERIGAVEGVEVALSYKGLVDLEVAALDAAYALGDRHLEGVSLGRYAEAHTAYVKKTGGPERYWRLQIFPERSLYHEDERWAHVYDSRYYAADCAYRWTKWQYPLSEPISSAPTNCNSMHIDPHNYACPRDGGCDDTTGEQKSRQEEVRSKSSGEFNMGTRWTFLKDTVKFQQNVNVNNVAYQYYVGVGAKKCYEILDIGQVWFPYLPQFEDQIKSLPGVKRFNVDVAALYLCASIGGGIAQAAGENPTGEFSGVLEARGGSGVQVAVKVWWVTVNWNLYLQISYPIALDVELAINTAEEKVTADIDLRIGPLSIVLDAGLFGIYFGVNVPATSGKLDSWHFTWRYGSSAASAPASGEGPLPPGIVEEDLRVGDRILPELPAGAARQHDEAEAALVVEGGVGVQVASILEVRPGDMYFNHLAQTGKLAALGIDPASVVRGQSVFLDGTDPRVQEVLYGGPTGQPPAVFGLPGGVTTASSSCDTSGFGLAVAVVLEDCDIQTFGVGAMFDETMNTGSGPIQDVKRLEEGVEESGESFRTILCNGEGSVCRLVTQVLSAPDGGHIFAPALEAQVEQVLMDPQGHVAFLTETCMEPQVHELVAWTGACMQVDGPSPDAGDASISIVPPSVAFTEFALATAEIVEAASAVTDHARGWGQQTSGQEDPLEGLDPGSLVPWHLIPDPGGNPFEPVNDATCLVLDILGRNPPSCQGA